LKDPDLWEPNKGGKFKAAQIIATARKALNFSRTVQFVSLTKPSSQPSSQGGDSGDKFIPRSTVLAVRTAEFF
jgi:hypothetical protein